MAGVGPGAGTGGEVFLDAWLDLRRLPLVMDDVAAQAEAIVDHARTWVAQRDGFEPSPVCLLRPIAEVMDRVAGAFEDVGRALAREWSEVRAGVVAAERELAAAEDSAAAASTMLAALVGADRTAA